MGKTISLEKKKNVNSVLPVLKALSIYESEITSSEDVINIYEKYKNEGTIKIKFKEDCLGRIIALCNDLELMYSIS
ncbi:hypothetical protein [Kordia zhangzhouensis]|uniref:hypothetical protein n=1 Tax=Kordia zhangzhouensis TaxID=1620405 RepID=UPI000629CBEE|nr:hypothetical protein [Kordia zhangzhouensis]